MSMTIFDRILIILFAIFVAGTVESQAQPNDMVTPAETLQPSSSATIKAHMAFLADDLLEGREAGTAGEARSALYIATQLQALGLQPAGEDGGFLQDVPLRSARLDQSKFEFSIQTNGTEQSFENGSDVAVSASFASTDLSAAGDVVFAGHGIIAPELGIDDYAGLDVNGKVVAVIGGPPTFLPSEAAAHFGSSNQKRLMAEARGAIGVLIIWTPALEKRYPFDLWKTGFASWNMTWSDAAGTSHIQAPDIILRAFVRGEATDAIFSGAPITAAQAIAKSETGPVKGFVSQAQVKLSLTTRHDDTRQSANVAALLPGSDPVLSKEIIVLTAHYDHVGICAPDEADKICNGALDNALGTALMLDVARALTEQETPPARSILFLAVGAEEKGLLGSDYFAASPTVQRDQIIANINLDGGAPFYDFSDVIAFGAEQSQMGEQLQSAIAPIGLTLAPDPFPEQGIFTRSDQYSFVKRGIPALFLYNGFTGMDGQNKGQDIWNWFFAEHYHEPSDDLSLPIDYTVSAKFSNVFRLLTLEVANAPSRPLWYDDSVFGQRFAADQPKAQRPQ
ncbi:M28 family metallopeptidase [Parasphingorhabdus cellanae]|uniref:M28 family peptidase n=1 Tax=Parasphingorhabdus cellanae TaxID=2806553 RepID=A0ABX7T587_9SPHN|nr:M28 family metallopeptidase [Parasphingorhabdus cellanae]QTD56088.1 M28 family peptidase [Parasphingorhabdus cellanae]